MNYETKASDWKVEGVGELSGAGGLAAGIWLFIFKSNSAHCTSLLAFSGFGLGIGFKWKSIEQITTGLSGPLFIGGEGKSIHCQEEFSAAQLNGKFGLISSAGAAAGAGYGVAEISAYTIGRNYFKFQRIDGWSSGVGASAINAFGTWWHISNPRKLGIVFS